MHKESRFGLKDKFLAIRKTLLYDTKNVHACVYILKDGYPYLQWPKIQTVVLMSRYSRQVISVFSQQLSFDYRILNAKEVVGCNWYPLSSVRPHI